METASMFLDILYNRTCLLCYKRSPDMMGIAEVLEIREQYSTKMLKLSDIVHYLFPSHDITCSQACRGCSDLLIKMYVTMLKNNFMKKLLNTLISHFNKNINKSNPENELIVNLTLQSKKGIRNKNKVFKKEDVCGSSKQINNILVDGSLQDHPQCSYKKSITQIKSNKNKRRKKYYNCNDCSYRSLCKGTLEGHINKHHIKIRPFVCGICYKSFYSKSNLTEHTHIHNKVGEICEVCGEVFGRRQSLVDHIRLHTNDRRYKCDVCDKYFVNSGRRLDHMKRTHLGKNECCMFCDKKFGMKKELIRHVKSVHT